MLRARQRKYAIILLVATSAVIALSVSAQQKNKNCFWSWHQGTQNWCRFSSQTGLCNYHCARYLTWFGECREQQGYQCQEVWGPVYVMGQYATCSPTLIRSCRCNTEWRDYTGQLIGKTCVGGPLGGGA